MDKWWMFQKFIQLTAIFEGDHPGTHIFGLPYLYSLQGWTWNATGETFNKQVQVLQDTREDTRDRTYRTWVFLGIGEQITCIAWEYRPAIGNGNKAWQWQRKEKEDHIECAQRGIWNRHVELIAYMTFNCQSAIVEILATCSQLPTARLGSNREQLKELARSWTFRHSAPESFTAEVDVPCIGANPRTVQVILPSRPGCLLRYSLDRVGSFKWVLWLRTWRKTIPNPCWCMIYHGFSHVISYFCLDTWFEVRLTWIPSPSICWTRRRHCLLHWFATWC